MCRKRAGCNLLLPAGEWFSYGKIPYGKRFHQKRKRRRNEEIYERAGMRILQALDKVAKQYNVIPAAVALAWLMARPSVTAPIASATSVGQLSELVSAVSIKLDKDTISKLDI